MRPFPTALLLCGVLLTVSTNRAQDKPAPPKTDLGFDASKAPPPDPKNDKPVVRVLDQYIYPDEPVLKAKVSDKDKMFYVQCYILCPLFDRLKQREKIEATREELARLEAFQKKTGNDSVGLTHLFFYRTLTGKHDPGQVRIDAIVLNKIDLALYERYGGLVGHNKFRGPMPVDAYRQFLEDAERTGAFEIFDRQVREAFFETWKQRPRLVVPPEEVDFNTPWWESAEADKAK